MLFWNCKRLTLNFSTWPGASAAVDEAGSAEAEPEGRRAGAGGAHQRRFLRPDGMDGHHWLLRQQRRAALLFQVTQ